MNRLIEKYGKLAIASFFLIAIGAILFLLTPILYGRWGIDSDLPGVIIIFLGIIIFIVGRIRKNKPRGIRLIFFVVLATILGLPIVFTIVSLIYYLVTRKPLG